MVSVNRLFVAYLFVILALVACATQATFAHEVSPAVSATNTVHPATNTPVVTCTVTAFHLHVRSGPGVEYHVVGYLDYGAMVQIYGRATNADGGTWLLVARNPEQWINADYVACR
jgi:uncharacterized protein YgiM (DUF1202 family)